MCVDIAGLRAILMGAVLLKDVNVKKSRFGVVRTQYVNFRTQSQRRLAHMNDSVYMQKIQFFLSKIILGRIEVTEPFLTRRNTTLNEKRILRPCDGVPSKNGRSPLLAAGKAGLTDRFPPAPLQGRWPCALELLPAQPHRWCQVDVH